MKLLKFYAEWCQPCKMLSKVMESVELDVPVSNIDIDKSMDTAIKYGVRGVPMLILVDEEGTAIRSKSGYMSEEDLVKFVKGE
jgi:thioredoxin 1